MEDVPTNDHKSIACFFGRKTLADFLQVSTRTVDRLDAARKLPQGRKIGSLKRWVRLEIEEWVAAGCPSRDEFIAVRYGHK